MVGSGKFQPFMRVGPVLGITKLLEERHERNTYDGITDFIWKYEYTGGLSLGFRGAVGVTYGLNEKLKLFSEINFQSMSYAPTKRTLTAYTVNGENRIDDISPENREQKLEKEYKTDSEEGTPPMRQPYSMNSWGLQVGVLFSFSK
jgi:hypothetical protein